jgi:hypothetical protein
MNIEPVAYINVEERKLEWAAPVKWDTPIIAKMDKIPLYTHPVKELTDEEICKIFNEHTGLGIHQKEADKADLLVFAKAILRKTQEK